MNILLTNDDGIFSPGLLALAKALRPAAELHIIAPNENRSAIGHSITLRDPLLVEELVLDDGIKAFSTDGTPSDCVRLAILGLIEEKPDLVIAGINMGANLGDDITYSGTVSCALEGVINGVPAIAISVDSRTDFHFEAAAAFGRRLVEFLSDRPIPCHTFLNVNVPNLPPEEIAGVEFTKLGRRVYREKLETKSMNGQTHYLFVGETPSCLAEEGTDFNAVRNGKISVTPLHIDMTDYRLLGEMSDWQLGLE